MPLSLQSSPHKYRLYVVKSCPFAHRARLVRILRNLEEIVDVSYAQGQTAKEGFFYDPPEPLFGKRYLRDVYGEAVEGYQGRFTTPLLLDQQNSKTSPFVGNDSLQLMWRLNDELVAGQGAYCRSLAGGSSNKCSRKAIEEFVDEYKDLPFLPYKYIFTPPDGAGMAKAKVVDEYYKKLNELEERMSNQKYLMGDELTLADVALWPTLVRFDNVYARQFRVGDKTIHESFPFLWKYVRRIYNLPGIAADLDMGETIRQYWQSENLAPKCGNDPLSPVPTELALDWVLDITDDE